MAMGIVSDEEFEREIPSTKVKEVEVIDLPNKGRGDGNVEVPDSLRKVIGEESAINGRKSALDLAAQFGISKSSVSAYSNGSTSTSSYDKQPNQSHITEAKARISKVARNKLMKTLHQITEDKLSEAKVKDLAAIARDMSVVIKNIEPEVKEDGSKQGPQFVIYAPQFRSEQSFEVIHAKE